MCPFVRPSTDPPGGDPSAGRPDSAAFEDLFRKHYAPLCDFVCGYVRSREVAQELVQDLFLRLWERGTAPAITLASAYLYTAARNRALRHLRHERVVARWADQAPFQAPTPAEGTNTDDDLCERELARALQQAVAQLPERRRLVFTLSRHQHLSNAEIAAALGISVKTVEQHMWQALKTLRAKLAPHLLVIVGVLAIR